MKLKSLIFIAFSFIFACNSENKEDNPLKEQINSIRNEYAPDKRVALFEVEAVKKNEKYILKGESDLPKGIEALKQKLTEEGINYVDSIQLLPSKAVADKAKGVIKISVANLRSNHAHSAELATQATLGTPVKVLKKYENWYLIQTPDKYLSWVDSGGIHFMDENEADVWRSSEKIIYTSTFGHVYAEKDRNSQIVSDIVAGGVLEKLDEKDGFFNVKFPDGRTGYIDEGESNKYNDWLAQLDTDSASLVSTSKTLMGVPYLWGGTSTKGVDCSGFTKTIYFLNGMVIPRDASQQVQTGKAIDSTKSFENLIEGDLLFFGRKATDSTKEKVVHVGMWMGNNEFIHSSGRVQVSSVDKNASNYDDYNHNRYLCSKRILKEENSGLINLVNTPVFKD